MCVHMEIRPCEWFNLGIHDMNSSPLKYSLVSRSRLESSAKSIPYDASTYCSVRDAMDRDETRQPGCTPGGG